VQAEGPLDFHVDGEPGRAANRLDVEILPGALTIRTV
jgi:diacylglycerol kinase family enzyme